MSESAWEAMTGGRLYEIDERAAQLARLAKSPLMLPDDKSLVDQVARDIASLTEAIVEKDAAMEKEQDDWCEWATEWEKRARDAEERLVVAQGERDDAQARVAELETKLADARNGATDDDARSARVKDLEEQMEALGEYRPSCFDIECAACSSYNLCRNA